MRTLPLLVQPTADETLFSFLRRLAAHNGGSLRSVVHSVGLSSDRTGTGLPADAAVYLGDNAIAGVAASTAVPPARLRQLLLMSLLDSVEGCPPGPSSGRLRWFHRRHLVAAGSHACPACLATDGVFVRWWRLAFAFACPIHRVLLEERCGVCGRLHDHQPGGRPALPSLVPQPGRCANSPSRREGPAHACGRRFSQALLSPVPEEVVAAQAAVLGVVRSRRGCIGGQEMDAIGWLAEFDGLVRFLRLYGTDAVLRAVAQANDTDGRSAQSARMALSSGGAPSVLAALVPVAVEIMSKPDLDALVDGIRPVADNARERGCRATSQTADVGLRGTTLHAWSLAVGHRARFASRLRSRSLPPARDPDMARRLPQLLWPEAVERFFGPVLEWVLPAHKRRYLSLALGVATTKGSFSDVAEQMGLRSDAWDAGFHKAVSNGLRQRREDEAVYGGVLACHEWISARTQTVDYERRRAVFSGPATITKAAWRWACWSTGSHQGARRRRREAEIWLWLVLTGNAFNSLPGVTTGPELAVQRAFVSNDLPRLETALLVLGARELCERGLGDGVRADLSGWDPTPDEPPCDWAAMGPFVALRV